MKNEYLPELVKVTKIEDHSPTVKLFRLEKMKGRFAKDARGLSHTPGQFVSVGMIGYGESPFGILSSPHENKYFEIAVRKVGRVTEYLHTLRVGDVINLRGPFGHGFAFSFFERKDIVAVTGGCGIPPIASLMEYIAANRQKYGKVYFIYGSKSPEEILLKDKIAGWAKHDIHTVLTVDEAGKQWSGKIGLVTDALKEIEINSENAVVAMCGPGPMIDGIEKLLQPQGISDRRMYVSMERKMQCGIGKCQHCTTGSKYVCNDGPVFNLNEIKKGWD